METTVNVEFVANDTRNLVKHSGQRIEGKVDGINAGIQVRFLLRLVCCLHHTTLTRHIVIQDFLARFTVSGSLPSPPLS